MYSELFKQLVAECCKNKIYVGGGNPSAKILFVGKEGSNENSLIDPVNAQTWQKCIDEQQADIYKYPNTIKRGGHTWYKYQKLHDFIFEIENNNIEYFNFQENVFTTEMNIVPAKNTGKARKDIDFKARLVKRKNEFLKSGFIQQFDVVVLACSDYFKNEGEGEKREIDTTFGVIWDKKEIIEREKKKYRFDTHYDKNKRKLVIHCRQLSGSFPDEYLQKIANIIREHLIEINKKS